MSLELYYAGPSAPCRAVLLTAKALNLELSLKEVDLMKKEQLKPEFLKINPQHVVPTLKDNEYVLWESRAVMAYLVNKYGGRDDKLYPKDPKVRGLIDQRMYFDALTLYSAFGSLYYPVLFFAKPLDDECMKKAKSAFEMFDILLDNTELYVAGDSITIADLTLVATVSSFEAVGFDLSPYKRVLAWYQRVKDNALGYVELNDKNLDVFKMLAKMNLGDNASKAPDVVQNSTNPDTGDSSQNTEVTNENLEVTNTNNDTTSSAIEKGGNEENSENIETKNSED